MTMKELRRAWVTIGIALLLAGCPGSPIGPEGDGAGSDAGVGITDGGDQSDASTGAGDGDGDGDGGGGGGGGGGEVDGGETGAMDGGSDAGESGDAGAATDGGGACVDDSREENDTRTQAKQTPAASHLISADPLQLGLLMACAGDPDYIYAYADCCQQFGAKVTWDPAHALTVELLGQNGQPLALDVEERTPGQARLYVSSGGGYFFVHVRSMGADVPFSVELLAPVYGP
jgi:hypothetical protein